MMDLSMVNLMQYFDNTFLGSDVWSNDGTNLDVLLSTSKGTRNGTDDD